MSEDIRPSYYGGKNNPFEPIKIIQHYGLCFEISNALKYCLRAGVKNKDTEIEDLVKAKTYLQLRIDYLESQKEKEAVKLRYEAAKDKLFTQQEGMHDKVLDVKKDNAINEYRKSLISLVETMGVKDGRYVAEFVDSILNIQLKNLNPRD